MMMITPLQFLSDPADGAFLKRQTTFATAPFKRLFMTIRRLIAMVILDTFVKHSADI